MIKFRTRVARVEQRRRLARAWRDGDDVRTEEEDLGWFVVLEGSLAALSVGHERPPLEVGDRVTVAIERSDA